MATTGQASPGQMMSMEPPHRASWAGDRPRSLEPPGSCPPGTANSAADPLLRIDLQEATRLIFPYHDEIGIPYPFLCLVGLGKATHDLYDARATCLSRGMPADPPVVPMPPGIDIYDLSILRIVLSIALALEGPSESGESLFARVQEIWTSVTFGQALLECIALHTLMVRHPICPHIARTC